ncbi:hypothetical protein [uncultured Desulfovibrio sp.]|uniref:hypothetical protein n=1 Tax=uncultured Desulfovibrio sp. TaxID=167968 RepID=UPI00260D6A0E|nr:hypothetical protein [uncultured Desulfovibrio sp.]
MKTPASLQTILDTASLSGRHVAGLRGDFHSRMAAFRRNRAASEQAALEEDFTLVLAAWGMADADIPGVVSALRLRLLVFAFPALACLLAAAWSHSPLSFLSLACIAPPCLLGMVTTLWRISILRHRRFTPLCRWLLRFRKRP